MKIDLSQIDHEEFEFLTADLLRCQGFTIESPPSRGPDQGKDLIAVRYVTDDLGITESERYLVECKHFTACGNSVRESDLGNFEAKMKQHNANRYLLVTTTTVSETVKNQLVAVSADVSSPRKATYWVKSDIIDRLQKHPDLFKKYFRSWQLEANEAVSYIHEHFFSAHRGAILWCPGITAVFGNDGYKDSRVRAAVERLDEELKKRDIERIVFSTNDYSWVVLVRSGNARELNNLVWQCSWVRQDHPAYKYERNEGLTRLYSYFENPHKPECPV